MKRREIYQFSRRPCKFLHFDNLFTSKMKLGMGGIPKFWNAFTFLAFILIPIPPPAAGATATPTFKLFRHAPDCSEGDGWNCFNYNGSLTYGDSCLSDDNKTAEFRNELDPMGIGPKDGYSKQEFIDFLDKNSCNTMQYLECRRISDKDSAGQAPQYRCACPDHERGDSPDAVTSSESYFDHKINTCVLKVRAKCTNLTIPHDDKRLNGTRRYLTELMRKVVDGRRQWLTLPCGRNARCKIQPNAPTPNKTDKDNDEYDDNDGSSVRSLVPWTAIDPSKNRCTCDSGFIVEDGEDGKCRPIDGQSHGPYPLGLLLYIVIFGVTLWIVLTTN